jgi:hypothetical protein
MSNRFFPPSSKRESNSPGSSPGSRRSRPKTGLK